MNPSKSYPETIPAPYCADEKASQAYRKGWNHGHGIACHNVPELGAKLRTDSLGRVTVDAENIREVHESLCFEAESSSRDFSPFEFIAHEFNSDEENSEGLWEAFEEGIADAIRADLATYTDEDYGIPVDPWETTPDGFTDYELPECWASALINGDESGLEASDIAELNAFLEKEKPGQCVECSDEGYFTRTNDAGTLAGNVLKFRFQTPSPTN